MLLLAFVILLLCFADENFFYPHKGGAKKFCLLRGSIHKGQGLETHAGVVVGALPEAGLGLGEVLAAVRQYGPPPFAVYRIYQIVSDKLPGSYGIAGKMPCRTPFRAR